MRLLFIILLLILTKHSINGQASNYVDWEWEIIRLGSAFAPINNNSGGHSGSEVRYNYSNRFSIGLAFNRDELARSVTDRLQSGPSTSTLLIGDYYLKGDSKNRAFFGLGAGFYESETRRRANSFGLVTRGGFELNRVRIQFQNNWTFQKNYVNFFNLSLGYTLWGGFNRDEE